MSCNHLSDCPRCGMIVDDFEDLVKDLKEEIERLNDDLKAERIALERTVSRIKRSSDEWPLRSRWVKISEREPNIGEPVWGRMAKQGGYVYGNIERVGFEDNDDIVWTMDADYYPDDDYMRDWEWLDVREKGGE